MTTNGKTLKAMSGGSRSITNGELSSYIYRSEYRVMYMDEHKTIQNRDE
jgi:hypothetical protein